MVNRSELEMSLEWGLYHFVHLILNLESAIWNLQSGICNLESAI